MTQEQWDQLKKQWTDKLVTLTVPEGNMARFASVIGRVVTVNGNGCCLVDFQDGGWYDIAPEQLMLHVDQAAAALLYQSKKNSAQKLPVRQQ